MNRSMALICFRHTHMFQRQGTRRVSATRDTTCFSDKGHDAFQRQETRRVSATRRDTTCFSDKGHDAFQRQGTRRVSATRDTTCFSDKRHDVFQRQGTRRVSATRKMTVYDGLVRIWNLALAAYFKALTLYVNRDWGKSRTSVWISRILVTAHVPAKNQIYVLSETSVLAWKIAPHSQR